MQVERVYIQAQKVGHGLSFFLVEPHIATWPGAAVATLRAGKADPVAEPRLFLGFILCFGHAEIVGETLSSYASIALR